MGRGGKAGRCTAEAIGRDWVSLGLTGEQVAPEILTCTCCLGTSGPCEVTCVSCVHIPSSWQAALGSICLSPLPTISYWLVLEASWFSDPWYYTPSVAFLPLPTLLPFS